MKYDRIKLKNSKIEMHMLILRWFLLTCNLLRIVISMDSSEVLCFARSVTGILPFLRLKVSKIMLVKPGSLLRVLRDSLSKLKY